MNTHVLTSYILENHVLPISSFEVFQERSKPINLEDHYLLEILLLHFAEHSVLSEALYFKYLNQIRNLAENDESERPNLQTLVKPKIPVDDNLKELIDDIL